MNFWDLFVLVIWAISGTITLCCKTVSKITYFFTWLVLMMYLFIPVLEVMLG
jgi:hypothetical protein